MEKSKMKNLELFIEIGIFCLGLGFGTVLTKLFNRKRINSNSPSETTLQRVLALRESKKRITLSYLNEKEEAVNLVVQIIEHLFFKDIEDFHSPYLYITAEVEKLPMGIFTKVTTEISKDIIIVSEYYETGNRSLPSKTELVSSLFETLGLRVKAQINEKTSNKYFIGYFNHQKRIEESYRRNPMVSISGGLAITQNKFDAVNFSSARFTGADYTFLHNTLNVPEDQNEATKLYKEIRGY